MDLAAGVLEGNRLALARLLTQVENQTVHGRKALSELFPYAGRAHLIGITGAPGTGKSSLVNQIARAYRQGDETNPAQKVAIVAVDPSSPFTGGAILGDRVRMRDLAGDPGVFIRSMASRGSLGGLASATSGVVQVLDAGGFEVILIETVGAGQAEVEIAGLAHTTLVIEAPGLGDDIQAIKAGILEIADILVINKADRPGVEATERALRNMLQLAHPGPRHFHHHGQLEVLNNGRNQLQENELWIPPLQRTVATEGRGVEELIKIIAAHRQFLERTGDWQRREVARLQAELDMLVQETLMARWRSRLSETHYHSILQSIVERKLSPWQALDVLLAGDEYDLR